LVVWSIGLVVPEHKDCPEPFVGDNLHHDAPIVGLVFIGDKIPLLDMGRLHHFTSIISKRSEGVKIKL